MNNTEIKAKWVLGRYNGKEAKRVMDMAHSGLGYTIVDQPEKGDAWVVAAFRKPIDGPLPDHLEAITDYRLLDKLESKRKERQGIHDDHSLTEPDTSNLTHTGITQGMTQALPVNDR